MKWKVLWMAALLAAGVVAPQSRSWAAELEKIERTIAQEPEYQSDSPRYCLLVFGPQAETRVWLVVDGTTLYVDRDGDGDLTDEGEQVVRRKSGGFLARLLGLDAGSEQFSIGTIEADDGKTRYEGLTLMAFDEDLNYVSAAIPELGSQGAMPVFAKSAGEAPIVHFGGPLTMHLDVDELVAGENELYAQVGTRGLGQRSFASISYFTVPAKAQPVVELEVPHKEPDQEPIRVKAVLAQRC